MRAKGIFISEFQNTFTYLGNIDYIWQRVTDGMVLDTRYYAMLPEVKRVPILGAVHNYRNHKHWKEQADFFLSLLDASFQMIAGDYEDANMTEESAVGLWCWLNYVAQEAELPVMYYVAAYNLRDKLIDFNGIDTVYGEIDFNGSNLWFARPVPNFDVENGEPNLSIGGVPIVDGWKFYQHNWEAPGSEYGCGSVHVCEDVFNGTVDELGELISKHGEPPIPIDLDEILDKLTRLTLSNSDEIERLASLVNTCSLGIAELARRLDTLQQGQLELAENGLGHEEKLKQIEDCTNEQYVDIASINRRIDGLAGGHNHPAWMRKLGLVRR